MQPLQVNGMMNMIYLYTSNDIICLDIKYVVHFKCWEFVFVWFILKWSASSVGYVQYVFEVFLLGRMNYN